jgi:hypothetical protein
MRRHPHPNRLAGMLGLGLTTLLALAPSALAQDGPPQVSAPPKQPPPPLFPRHRRGIYQNREGLDVIDATPQSPPLETDDPGVPDKGEYEINPACQLRCTRSSSFRLQEPAAYTRASQSLVKR